MSRQIIQFVQNLLENVNVPVHFVTPPCSDFAWLDQGLRAALPGADYIELFANQWFADLNPRTIYHAMDTFHCCYTILCPSDEQTFMSSSKILTPWINGTNRTRLIRPLLMRKKAEEVGIHPIHLDLYPGQIRNTVEEITQKDQCNTIYMNPSARSPCRINMGDCG